MDIEPEDEDTFVKPRVDPRVVDRQPSVEDLDADTIIRERVPFADVPIEALQRVSEPVAPSSPPSDHGAAQPPVDLGETQPNDYSFVVNADPAIRLDLPAIIGRRPSLPRIMKGRPPRLVRVPSPLREVSSTHLELRQQGALVVVTDLRSTNGSIVTVPGRDPVKLRQGESAVVIPGTTIDVGDGNVVRILPVRAQSNDFHPERRQT